MNIWEAKYRALCQGIANKEMIENAELLVKKSMDLSAASMHDLGTIIDSMLHVVFFQQAKKTISDIESGKFNFNPEKKE